MKEGRFYVEKMQTSEEHHEERWSNHKLNDDASTNVLPRTPFLSSLRNKHRKQVNSDKVPKNWHCRNPRNETFFSLSMRPLNNTLFKGEISPILEISN
jgi:hypothetical protein